MAKAQQPITLTEDWQIRIYTTGLQGLQRMRQVVMKGLRQMLADGQITMKTAVEQYKLLR